MKLDRTEKLISISCPFCGEEDYNLPGLKKHFSDGWCNEFSTNSKEEREILLQTAMSLLERESWQGN